jgi:hypothetical protein
LFSCAQSRVREPLKAFFRCDGLIQINLSSPCGTVAFGTPTRRPSSRRIRIDRQRAAGNRDGRRLTPQEAAIRALEVAAGI